MSGPLPAVGATVDLPESDPLHGLAPAALARTVRTNPVLALRYLRQPRRLPQPAVQSILLAETLHRLGHRDQAATEAITAVTLAADIQPPQRTVLLAAVTVLTDITVCTPDSNATAACIRLRELAAELDDPHRLLIADLLLAVAVYHHDDCDRGRQRLTALHHDHGLATNTEVAALLPGAAAAMTAWCTDRPATASPLDRRLTPAPGGLLHTDLSPTPDWLHQRITAQRCPGTHPAGTGPARREEPR